MATNAGQGEKREASHHTGFLRSSISPRKVNSSKTPKLLATEMKAEYMKAILQELETPPGVQVRKCSHGFGSFTLRSFEKGEVIDERMYSLFKNAKEAPFCTLPIPSMNYYFGYPSGVHKWDCLLDHSENPNICYKIGEMKNPFIWASIFTTRNVPIGEELFLNYHESKDRVYLSPRYKNTLHTIL